jgi:nucleoside-diphosphate-sugar epimerase
VRVVVTGASGNVGTSLLARLAEDPDVESVLGLCRRMPQMAFAKTTWRSADVSRDDLTAHLRGADAVVHLAWLIQPSHDERTTRRVNVEGSARVFEAVARAGVPALVYASSIGAYAPGPRHGRIDESWPTTGVHTSYYSRQKSAVERLLDRFAEANPDVRVVRLRPALIFKRGAASEIRRLFLGPLLPGALARPEALPVLPLPAGLRTQAVHSLDVGEAYRLAVTGSASGAFNIAAEPELDADAIGATFGVRTMPVPRRLLRFGAALSWRLHLQPTSPGWLDMGLALTPMDCTRARSELGWAPRHSAQEALAELVEGLREGAGLATPPLDPATGGPLRIGELRSGIGARA